MQYLGSYKVCYFVCPFRKNFAAFTRSSLAANTVRHSADHSAKAKHFIARGFFLMSQKLNFLMSQKLITLMSQKVRYLMPRKLFF